MSRIRVTVEDLESKQKIQAEIDPNAFMDLSSYYGVDYEKMIIEHLLSELRSAKIQQEKETLINF